ncbi:hypothetical protein NliqN6_5286 [Naganishia liquefaciens]|uniref:Uncharacterized protein n=1 Tax=Naganishia liquefaciens TaxID=104408 RepID=A0A8H3YGL6_9TREE|nr:hypothetical protein NliqN6_5286 [Naganishia liquefaciens]
MDNPRHATGPVRPSARKREKKASSKPYARPEGKASTTTVAKPGIQHSDSQTSLFGGLKSVFKSFFSSGDAEGSLSKRTERSDDPDRTRSVDGDFATDSEDDVSGGDSFSNGPKRNDSDEQGKRSLPSPEHAQPSSKRLRRASPPTRNGMNNSMSLGYAGPSLASLARSQGIKRSGTLLDLDLRKSRPAPAQGSNAAWSPWTEQAEAHERKARTTTTTTTGFARSGSIGYGLHAVAASPLRPQTSSLFAPHASPARTSRAVLQPLKSASLIRRSPSLPLGPRAHHGAGAMRDPYTRRETTALASSPVTAHHVPRRWQDDLERQASPAVRGRLPRDSSVLSGMSELVVREPTARPRDSVGKAEMFETQHRSEAERILANLSSMRSGASAHNTVGGLSASFSSRTLRKQIAIPAASDRRESVSEFSTATGTMGLGLMRRARETEGESVMVSPYGKRRARGKIQVVESEESEEDKDKENRMSPTPVREPSRKPSASPASSARADPATFPEPAVNPVPKPLPVAFSPSAKNLPSAAAARAKTSSLRAKTTMTTRKHTSAAGSRQGSRFSALDDDDEEDADDYSLDIADLEAAAQKRDTQAGTSAFSAAPKITGPMDLFAPKPSPADKPGPVEVSSKSDAPSGIKQAPGFLNVKVDHKPRASSPLKAMIVPSPESNKASPSTASQSQPSDSAATPALGATPPALNFFAPPSEPKESAPAGKPFSFGLGKPSAPASGSTTTTSSAFSFGTPAKTVETQDSTTPAGPAPATSFSFKPAEKAPPPAASGFSFGAPSASGPPSLFSAADKPSAPPVLAAPAEPKGVAPPKSNLFNFSAPAPASAAPAIAPAVASSLPTGNPFAAAPSTTASTPADKPSSSTTNSFSFGNVPGTATPAEPKAPASTPAPSLFGATGATPAPSTPAFNFGSPAPSAPTSTSKSSFTFGGPTEAPKPASSAFTFGSTPSASAEAPKPAAATFTFGSTSSAPTPAEAPKPASSSAFTFGSTNSAPAVAEAPKPASSSAFTFGSTTAPAPAASEKPASCTFNFGSSATPAPAAAATPAFGGFGVGASTPSAAPSTSFNFGSTAPSFGAPAPATTGFGAPSASTSFGAPPASSAPVFGGFGSVATPTPPTSASTFNFGAPATPVANSPFNFGAAPAAPAAQASAPSFGGFSAPSPAFGAREATATPPPVFSMGADNAPGSPGAAGRRIRGIPKRVKKP